jgi:hypothetical protein
MNGFSRLALIETRLFLRERAAAIAVFGLPVGLVIGFGLIPGFSDPQKSLSGQRGTEYIAALGVAIVLATLGLNGVPMVIGQYRERGILRRLAVTPVRPLTLLVAKLAVWAGSAALSVALIVAVARLAFHVPVPAAAGWFVLAFVLGVASLFEPWREPRRRRPMRRFLAMNDLDLVRELGADAGLLSLSELVGAREIVIARITEEGSSGRGRHAFSRPASERRPTERRGPARRGVMVVVATAGAAAAIIAGILVGGRTPRCMCPGRRLLHRGGRRCFRHT